MRKIDSIRLDIEAVELDQNTLEGVPQDQEVDNTQTLSDFQPLTEADVSALI